MYLGGFSKRGRGAWQPKSTRSTNKMYKKEPLGTKSALKVVKAMGHGAHSAEEQEPHRMRLEMTGMTAQLLYDDNGSFQACQPIDGDA